jgi:hypothetical protein
VVPPGAADARNSGLIDPQAWRALAAIDHAEVAIAAVTTGCVVVFGVLQALIVAVGLSMIDTVRRSASPHDAVLGWVERLGRYADVSVHHQARLTPGVVVYRLDDRLFFANARYFQAPRARGNPGGTHTGHTLVALGGARGGVPPWRVRCAPPWRRRMGALGARGSGGRGSSGGC